MVFEWYLNDISCKGEYRDQVNKLISLCTENILELNVNETKGMIVDFRRKKSSPLSPLLVDGRTVVIVQHLKFLGSTISNHLKWELNIVVNGAAAVVLSNKVEII